MNNISQPELIEIDYYLLKTLNILQHTVIELHSPIFCLLFFNGLDVFRALQYVTLKYNSYGAIDKGIV